MDNLVLRYVAKIVPIERTSLYGLCHTLLCDYYPDGWPTVLDAIAESIEQQTINDVEYQLHSAIIDNLSAMCRECGVDFSHRFDPHPHLRFIYHLAHGLFNIEHYPNMVALLARYQAHDTGYDQFASVLLEVEPGFDEHLFYEAVANISLTASEALETILTSSVELAAPLLDTHPILPLVQQTIVTYAAAYPALAEVPYQYIGGTLDAYVDFYRTTLEQLPPPAAARLCMLCVVMARLPEDAGRQAVSAVIAHLYAYDAPRALATAKQFTQLPFPTLELTHDKS